MESPLSLAKLSIDIVEAGARLFPSHILGTSCRSPLRQDRNPSFSVYADGKRWHDFGTGEDGDVVDFVAMAQKCSLSDAAKELIRWARADASGAGGNVVTPSLLVPAVPAAALPKPSLRPMEGAVLASWVEGGDYLGAHREILRKLEDWRAWHLGLGDTLFEDGTLSAPLRHGMRGLAFRVQAPFTPDADSIGLIDIGFHVRLQPRYTGDRSMWAFFPNTKIGGGSVPALPFVLGAGCIRQARIVIVTEGQWDSITLSSQAGWLVSDTSWPEHIVLFGVRGAGGWRPLLDWWGNLWPANARFILFRDADAAGARWLAPGNFVDALRQRGHAVRVICSRDSQQKDLNEIHRASPLGRDELITLIN